jgi:probable HAF family extracellular repeat protein
VVRQSTRIAGLSNVKNGADVMATYFYTTIDDPLGSKTIAYGINASGQIVGLFSGGSFLYSGGAYTTLNDPLGTTTAYGINDSSQVVGNYTILGADSALATHGFSYSGGTYTTIDDPSAGGGITSTTSADGINNDGQIVGYYRDSFGSTHGFLYSGGIYTTLDDPLAATSQFGFSITVATGINDSGQIVGYYNDGKQRNHGFLYDGGTYTTLDDPLATNGSTVATGINAAGQIVGYYTDGTTNHGFLYSGGTYTTLDAPFASSALTAGTFANGINDAGDIVGYYIDSAGVYHGFEAAPVQVTLGSTLDDFSWAQGWGSADDPRSLADVNGDGNSDYVGFGYSATFIAYGGTFSSGGSDGPGFSSVSAAVNDFGSSEGYTADVQRGAAAAGVGDGDILYGQGYAGVYWYEATGETAETDAAGNTYDVLQYQTSPNFYGNFGTDQGWTSDNGFQILKTSSTDNSASILGFGYSGIVVGPDAFSSGASAASSYTIPLDVGNGSGWKQSVDVRTFTDLNGKTIDLNGDGIADFVGMGPDGLVYAYGSGSGSSYTLGTLETAHIDGGNSDLGEAQGWTDATTVRDLIYDPKTGYYDIIAFGAAGVYVSMGQNPTTHSGEPFGQLYLAMADFGSNQGWTVSQTPRLIGDVTGDGSPDIVGFGTNDTYVAVGSYDSSGNLQFKIDPTRTIADFGSAEGWSGSTEQTLRALGTVVAGSGSSHSDLILSGASNTQVWHFT